MNYNTIWRLFRNPVGDQKLLPIFVYFRIQVFVTICSPLVLKIITKIIYEVKAFDFIGNKNGGLLIFHELVDIAKTTFK